MDIDDIRKEALTNLVDYYVKEATDENSELEVRVREKSKRFKEILDTLSSDDRDFVFRYVDDRADINNEIIDYVFNKGLELGCKIAQDPSILFGNKNTHLNEGE